MILRKVRSKVEEEKRETKEKRVWGLCVGVITCMRVSVCWVEGGKEGDYNQESNITNLQS